MPFSDGYNKTIYIDEDVTPTGTPDLNAANLNNNENFTKTLSTQMSTTVGDVEALETTVAGLGAGYIDPTFITGLKLVWVSSTQISVTSGACYTLASSGIGEATVSQTLTPTLSASTWYYIYASNVSGTLSYQVSTTVPVSYMGAAKQKTGDSSWRFLGSFRTNASSQIMKAKYYSNGRVAWLESTNATPLLVLPDGRATTETNVSCAGGVPPHSQRGVLELSHIHNGSCLIGTPDDNITLGPTSTDPYIVRLYPVLTAGTSNSQLTPDMPLDSSQQFSYRFISTPSVGQGLVVGVLGYYEETK